MEKGEEIFDEEKLHERLMVYNKALEMGGVLWTEQQVEFLKMLSDELERSILTAMGHEMEPKSAFDRAVERYNAPPKEEAKVEDEAFLVFGNKEGSEKENSFTIGNLPVKYIGEEKE